MLPKNITAVILSRHRQDTLPLHTLPLFPYATVTVDESELDAYADVVPRKQLLPHPTFDTMADLRNWILATVDTEFQVHIHDDLKQLRSLVGWRPRAYKDPAYIAALLESTCVCAKDAGAYLFGYGNIAGGPMHYDKMRPFRFNGFIRNVIGFRHGHDLHWDPAIMGHYDVDLSLQALMKHRIIWRDERFIFEDVRLGSNRGGFSGVRTQAGLDAGRQAMLDKWGSRYVRFAKRGKKGQVSTTEATIISVKRRDPAVGR